MGRLKRLENPYLDYHVIVRCLHDEFLLHEDEDFLRYLEILHLMTKKHELKIYNYVLMNSHVHLYLRPSPTFPLSKTMMFLNWKTARENNRRNQRRGTFWGERYKCFPVESERHGLALMAYMDRNPLRGGMIKKLGQWKWGGYSFYARGVKNDILSAHPSYLELSPDPLLRQKIYRDFTEIGDIKRNAMMSEGPVIGSEEFIHHSVGL